MNPYLWLHIQATREFLHPHDSLSILTLRLEATIMSFWFLLAMLSVAVVVIFYLFYSFLSKTIFKKSPSVIFMCRLKV